jgi:hypothetical protein
MNAILLWGDFEGDEGLHSIILERQAFVQQRRRTMNDGRRKAAPASPKLVDSE